MCCRCEQVSRGGWYPLAEQQLSKEDEPRVAHAAAVAAATVASASTSPAARSRLTMSAKTAWDEGFVQMDAWLVLGTVTHSVAPRPVVGSCNAALARASSRTNRAASY